MEIDISKLKIGQMVWLAEYGRTAVFRGQYRGPLSHEKPDGWQDVEVERGQARIREVVHPICMFASELEACAKMAKILRSDLERCELKIAELSAVEDVRHD